VKTPDAAFEGFGRDDGDDDEPEILTVAILVYNILACGRRSYVMLCYAVTLSVIVTALTVQELVVRCVMYFVDCSSIGTDGVIKSLRSKLNPELKSLIHVLKSKLGSMPTSRDNIHRHYAFLTVEFAFIIVVVRGSQKHC
jgi:hypothetical protein